MIDSGASRNFISEDIGLLFQPTEPIIAQEKENVSSNKGPQSMELGQLNATPYQRIKGPLMPAKKEDLRKMNACISCRKQGHSITDCPETTELKSGN